jgi:hypothetical protein
MTIARSAQFDAKDPPWIHAISRCVRKAFLCGGREGKYDHRRDWVEERLAYLAAAFAVDIASYAVMANHLHVVLRMRVDEMTRWSAHEVAQRWLAVYPRQYLSDGTPVPPSAETVERCARDAAWVAKRRARLADLGWFMSALKTPIARRANKEDGCRGVFWESRYTSVPLLDHAALVACMAYVDLNPVRARVTDRPERSTHTSVRQRVRARQRTRVVQRARAQATTPAKAIIMAEKAGVPAHEQNAVATNPEHGLWIAPLAGCKTGDVMRDGSGYMAEEYLALVDATGRVLRPGKRGAIPGNLAPLLARLDIEVEDWIATMVGWRSMNGGAVGGYTARQAEATRRGLGWVRTRCALFPRPAEARQAG